MNPLFPVLLFDDDTSPVAIAIACVVITGLAAFLFFTLRDGVKILRTEYVKAGGTTYAPEAEMNVDLQLANFSYYRKLTPQRKKEFVHRILNFIETHIIEGEGDFDPQLREKIHVAAAATQLTFGMRDFIFTHFETVLLYPGIFRIHPDGPLMKGATTPNGVIRISIRDFEAGYANPTDKLNVGLHEFGHALFMELLMRANDPEGNDLLKINMELYREESEKILNRGKHADDFLRDYAFTNRHEFFAVSVEHFFEAPEEFSKKLPVLYAVLKTLLKQDTSTVKPDYGITRNSLI